MTTSPGLTPSELWVQITAMPRPHRTVDFPRMNDKGEPVAQISMQVLTQEEQITASIESERFSRKHIKDMPKSSEPHRGYDDTYNNQAACEILFRACRRVDDMTLPFFPSPSAIRQNLTPDEVGVLVRSYYIVQDEVGPIIAKMSSEETEAWIMRLKEGASGVPLAYLSPEAATQLVLSLVSRVGLSATPTSSHGTPSEESMASGTLEDDAETLSDGT